MNWKLFGSFGILISVILALSLGLTLPKKNGEPDHPATEATTTTQQTMTTSEPPANDELVAVNPLNFVRAETDRNMNLIRLKILRSHDETADGLNFWGHLEDKGDGGVPIVRPNFDTIYSAAILDTESGKIMIELPKSERYMSVYCFDQDQYQVYYGTAPTIFHIKREFVKTQYVICLLRTSLLENTQEDIEEVKKLQNGVKLTTSGIAGQFRIPNYDPISAKMTRTDLRHLILNVRDFDKMFGNRYETDTIQHMLGVAVGWGGLPQAMAVYDGDIVECPDGEAEYEITLSNVPVDAFWSITVYDADGFIFDDVESINTNSYLAKPNSDGSVTITFSNSIDHPNNLNIGFGWSYLFRFYEPREELLQGKWAAPRPTLINSNSICTF